jgi:hypothetical protein
VARWDGTGWSPVGAIPQALNTAGLALAVYQRELIVGGAFQIADGSPAARVARFGVADADLDGVGNVCDACPNTITGVTVDDVGCPPSVPADFDRDGDVDGQDLGHFMVCATGASVSGPPAGCSEQTFGAADADADADVDADDFGEFQRCYSGSGLPAPQACVQPQ